MSRKKRPSVPDQKNDWLEQRLTLCREASQEIKKFDSWATKLYDSVQIRPVITASSCQDRGK